MTEFRAFYGKRLVSGGETTLLYCLLPSL
jgi:hypothetical protein